MRVHVVFCVLYDLCEELVNNFHKARIGYWHNYLNISSNEHLAYNLYDCIREYNVSCMLNVH